MLELAPAVYEHAASLINRSPWDVSRDSDLLICAHAAAHERYGHSPVVVGIDIYNLEVEAYGATVDRPEGNAIPSIKNHPFSELSDILALEPFDPASDGRIAMILRSATELAAKLPDADIRVPVSGPFSIASGLMGFDKLLMDCVMEPELTAETIKHLADNQLVLLSAISAAGLGVSLFESAATPPLISPDMFDAIELPALKKLCVSVEDIFSRPASCILGGDSLAVLKSLLETGCKYIICPAETNQAAFIDYMADKPEIHVRVNMNPAIVASHDFSAMREEVNRVAALVASRQNSSVGTSVLPYETPPGNIDKIRQMLIDC